MKDLILLFIQLLVQREWIKYALDIILLTLGAAVARAIALRLFKRSTTRLNWEHKHFLLTLIARMIAPILLIAVVAAGFDLLP